MNLGHIQEAWGLGCGAVSEQSPGNISKEPSVSEKDNIHLSVKQCGDGEGLSLAGLQENTETNLLLNRSLKCFY